MPKFVSTLVDSADVSRFLKQARDRFELAMSLDAEDRKFAADDAEFALAEPRERGGTTQWHQKAAEERIKDGRPCLTENRLLTFTAQVVNDGRQSKPAIQITALDDGTKETAGYYQGRIRHIEYDSNADTSYDTAREQQVTCGRGYLRVNWEYEPKSFRRRGRIQRIDNQFSVLFGPAKEYDCSDATYCFVFNAISKETHEQKYGRDTTAARTDFAQPGNPAPGWLGVGPNGEMVQEAEYWVKEEKARTLSLLSNGKVFWKDEIPEGIEELRISVSEERQDLDTKVIQYIIDGADILAENDSFPGPFLPIVPQWGREYFLDGKRRTLSLLRQAKDPQRLLNLYVSNIAEQVGMMPKTPFWVPNGSIPSGSLQAFQTLNDKPRSYMLYNQYDPQHPDRQFNIPHRETNEPPIVALVTGYNQAVDAIKAAMGIFDASLGNRSNETSGIAINARQREADNANFHFHDNETRTRRQVGRILLYLISEMDKGVGDRMVRSENGETRLVRVGAPWFDKELKKRVHHELSPEHYGVACETGPSYNSAREKGFDELTKMATQWPLLLQVGGPSILRMSDIPGSDGLADLMEKTLPAELQSQKDQQPGIPPEVAAKFQQLQQQAGQVIEGLTGKVNELQEKLNSHQMEIDAKERIAELQEETRRLIAAAQFGQRGADQLLMAELQKISQRIDQQQAERDREHAAWQADLDRRAAEASQQADQEHERNMAEQQPQPPPPAGGEQAPEAPGV